MPTQPEFAIILTGPPTLDPRSDPHAINLHRYLPLRRRRSRGHAGPRPAHLPLQLQHLPPHALLARRGAARGLSHHTGEGDLTRYTFGTHKNHHYFCRHCGVRVFGHGTDTPMGEMYGVNVGCINGLTDEDLARLAIVRVDGLHDQWQQAPAHSGYL